MKSKSFLIFPRLIGFGHRPHISSDSLASLNLRSTGFQKDGASVSSAFPGAPPVTITLNVQTLRLFANDDGSVEHASGIIRDGGLVAFPTETVYGLGGNAFDAAAVIKIFLAKDRPAWDPIIVHVSSPEMLEAVTVSRPVQFDNLFRAFMPGPLTLVMPKSAAVPDVVTAGRETVAVRFPAHPVAQRLIASSGLPIAAPSANRFQHVSPTTAEHATAELDERIEAILDGGPCQIGVESTVLDLTAETPLILRQGAVTLEHLQGVLGEVVVANPEAPSRPQRGLRSPGMMSRHYAPRTGLVVTDGREQALAELDQEMSEQKVGALLSSRWIISAATRFDWGQWGDWTMLASRLYAGLHWLDAQKLDLLIAPLPPNEGLGGAIRERLLKASGRRCLQGKSVGDD
jgi:L-threonylcarbamoyladenylate synthase